jgi:hypothetical protein
MVATGMNFEKPTPDRDSFDVESSYGEADDSEGLLGKTRKSLKPKSWRPFIAVAFCLLIIVIQTVLLLQVYAELRQYTVSSSTSPTYTCPMED